MVVKYQVVLKKSVLKNLPKLPRVVLRRFNELADVLAMAGPTGPHGWQNYSALSETEYHCHLKYHWVAC